MNQNYTKAIKAILNFKNIFDSIDPKTSRKLVGEVGEFYVLLIKPTTVVGLATGRLA